MKTILFAIGLALCWAMFPGAIASALALVVIGAMLITCLALYLSVLFAPPRLR